MKNFFKKTLLPLLVASLLVTGGAKAASCLYQQSGGTGTCTPFTAGSIPVSSGSGLSAAYNQDNANFFYDLTNHRLGFGTTAPTHTLTFASNATGEAFYNTSDQTVNYERAREFWNGNVFNINTEAGGTGTLRGLAMNGKVSIGSTTLTSLFNVGTAAALQIDTSGNLATTGTGAFGTAAGASNAKLSVKGNTMFGNAVTNNLSWGSIVDAIELGDTGTLFSNNNGSFKTGFYNNAYYNGTNNLYIKTAPAQIFTMDAGGFSFVAAPSGTAGTAATFSTVMIASTTGVAIGTSGQFNVNSSGAITAAAGITTSGTINFSGLTASSAVATDASKNLISVTNTGTGNNVLATNPTLSGASLGTSTATTQTAGDNSTNIATTAYVANAVLGQNYKEAAKYATTAALASATYSNGASGVGATLTGVGLGAITVDGSTPSVGDRILVKNQASTFQNGIYSVTTVGNVGVAFVLTRTTDFNQSAEINAGDTLFVSSGTANGATTWAYTGIDAPTMGTTAITFAQTAGQGSYTAGTGLTLTGTAFSVNSSQNIATLSNLTSNGLVTTSGGGGTLSVTVPATGMLAFLGTPSSANLAATVTDETGSGLLVFGTSPTLVTPALGTPSALVATNATGTAAGLTSGITNALKSATTTVDVSAATAPTSGQVLTATSGTTATWQSISGAGSTSIEIPKPAFSSGLTSDVTMGTNTVLHVGRIHVDTAITFTKLSFNVTSVSVAGTYKVAIYSDSGSTQLLTFTTGTVSALGIVTTTVTSTTLAAGYYYVAVLPVSTASANLNIYTFSSDGSNVLNQPSGLAGLSGTLSVTASTMPSTITPTSITPIDTATLVVRLDS